MDIRKIALYLSGKLPPYYWNSQRIFFIRQLRLVAKEFYTNEEIAFIDQQTRNNDENFFAEILEDQKKSSQEIFEKLINLLGLPPEVLDVSWSDVTSKDLTSPKEKVNPDKVITQYIHDDLKSIFAWALEIKKYDGLTFEAIKVINERLHDYAQKKWLGDIRENDAVNQLFDHKDNIFWFDLTSDTWKSQNQWLQNLMNWVFSYFRNPIGHEKDFIKWKEEFIQILLFISMLLKILDEKKIK